MRNRDLKKVVEKVLGEAGPLERDRPLVAGFSGGADSLCLIYLLKELGWRVVAAHFDHGLRPESAAEAQMAALMAEKLGIPFLLGHGDVQAEALRSKTGIEAAARRLRYQFLFACAGELGAQAVCTGHTADDQAETVLLHLLRGAGKQGLAGMEVWSLNPEWDGQISLLRPLLTLTREETERCCRQIGARPNQDPSNFSGVYQRNRIRAELLPLMEQFNPSIRQSLQRLAQISAADSRILTEMAEADAQKVLRSQGEGYWQLDAHETRALGKDRLANLLRWLLDRFSDGDHEFSFEDIQRAVAGVFNPPKSERVQLANAVQLLREADDYLLGYPNAFPPPSGYPALPGEGNVPLEIPGQIHLAQGWVLHLDIQACAAFSGADDWTAWFQMEDPSDLVLDHASTAERMQPVGMNGQHQKLSDVFINAGIPRRARALYPVVRQGEQILWIPGVRRSLHHLITDPEQPCIRIRVVREAV